MGCFRTWHSWIPEKIQNINIRVCCLFISGYAVSVCRRVHQWCFKVCTGCFNICSSHKVVRVLINLDNDWVDKEVSSYRMSNVSDGIKKLKKLMERTLESTLKICNFYFESSFVGWRGSRCVNVWEQNIFKASPFKWYNTHTKNE